MQPKLEWHPMPEYGDERWTARSYNCSLTIFKRGGRVWWLSMWFTPHDLDRGCSTASLLSEPALIDLRDDVVNVMIRCEVRAREVLMAQFGELIVTPSSAADRGAGSER